MSDKTTINKGYQPLREGYQPQPKPQNPKNGNIVPRGYQPTNSQKKSEPNPPPKKP